MSSAKTASASTPTASGLRPMEIPHPVPSALAELVAQRFRVLGEPMRIRLLDRLREATATVGELRRRPALRSRTSPSTSACCSTPGSSAARKDGNFVRYSIADAAVFELCEQVCGGLRRQLDELEADAREEARDDRIDRAAPRRAAGRSSASSSRSPAR